MDESKAKQNEQVAVLIQTFTRLCEYALVSALELDTLTRFAESAQQGLAATWNVEAAQRATRDLRDGTLIPRIFQDKFVIEARQEWARRR